MSMKKPPPKMTDDQQWEAFVKKAKELEIDETEDGFANLIVDLVPLKTKPPVVPATTTLTDKTSKTTK